MVEGMAAVLQGGTIVAVPIAVFLTMMALVVTLIVWSIVTGRYVGSTNEVIKQLSALTADNKRRLDEHTDTLTDLKQSQAVHDGVMEWMARQGVPFTGERKP